MQSQKRTLEQAEARNERHNKRAARMDGTVCACHDSHAMIRMPSLHTQDRLPYLATLDRMVVHLRIGNIKEAAGELRWYLHNNKYWTEDIHYALVRGRESEDAVHVAAMVRLYMKDKMYENARDLHKLARSIFLETGQMAHPLVWQAATECGLKKYAALSSAAPPPEYSDSGDGGESETY